jgi:DNA end-binding protein Ku
MHSIWKGAISFGLVNIPVKLYNATHEHELKFHLLHKRDLSEIRYAKICKEEEKEIPYEEIVKGYELSNGEYVVLTEEDFKSVEPEKDKLIEIINFTMEDEIDPMYYEKPYFIEPEKTAAKPYAMLCEALKKSKKVGIAKCVLRNHERIGILRPYGKALVLNQIRLHSEIYSSEIVKIPESKVSSKEIDLALELIDRLTKDFHPEAYKDNYTEKLLQLIHEKGKGKKRRAAGKAAPKPTKVHDIMALLKASLQADRRKAPKAKTPSKRKAK